MTDIQLAHLSFGGEGRDRNREHQVALREARIATDHRALEAPAAAPRPGIAQRLGIGRLRLAIAGGPAVTEACNCPA